MAYRARIARQHRTCSPAMARHPPDRGGALLREVPGDQDEPRAAGRVPAVPGRVGAVDQGDAEDRHEAGLGEPDPVLQAFSRGHGADPQEPVRPPDRLGRDRRRARAHPGVPDRARVASSDLPGDQLRPGHPVDVARPAGLPPAALPPDGHFFFSRAGRTWGLDGWLAESRPKSPVLGGRSADGRLRLRGDAGPRRIPPTTPSASQWASRAL